MKGCIMPVLQKVCLAIMLLVICGICDGYKILVVFPNTARSHAILGYGYVDSLLEAGHEVTFITGVPRKDSSPNLTQIDVNVNVKFHTGKSITLSNIMDDFRAMNTIDKVFGRMYEIAKSTTVHKDVQRLLKDPQQRFDLIVAEWLFSDFYAGFSAVFNCPYVWAVSMNPSWLSLRLIEGIRTPEYCPDIYSENYPPVPHALRLRELIIQVGGTAMQKFKFASSERKLYADHIVPILKSRGRSIPNFDELVYNASLLMVNSQSTVAQVMALPSNFVAIGGYHINPRIPLLPNDLLKLMNEATDGVIFFSMGTIVRIETFQKSVLRSLLDMFKDLKQLVLWKFQGQLSNLPKNVYVLPWAPQQSILNHPNCVLFITHGGMLSITEAVHFGVPLVVIPVFADQFANAAKLQLRGISRTVEISYSLTEDLRAEIQEVIGNVRYKQNVHQLSALYHDQKSPRRRLVDWLEYVIRTGGAVHLRSPATLIPWYQQVYLDSLLLIIVVMILSWAMRMILRRLLKVLLKLKQQLSFKASNC